MKKVPFNLEQWQANGSKVEDLEFRNGQKPDDAHYFNRSNRTHKMALSYGSCIYATNEDGRYSTNVELETSFDLFMYVPTPTEIKSGEWVAKKVTEVDWVMLKGNVSNCNYNTISKLFYFYGNLIKDSDLQPITDLITQINAL